MPARPYGELANYLGEFAPIQVVALQLFVTESGVTVAVWGRRQGHSFLIGWNSCNIRQRRREEAT